jgi:hypothetical protein
VGRCARSCAAPTRGATTGRSRVGLRGCGGGARPAVARSELRARTHLDPLVAHHFSRAGGVSLRRVREIERSRVHARACPGPQPRSDLTRRCRPGVRSRKRCGVARSRRRAREVHRERARGAEGGKPNRRAVVRSARSRIERDQRVTALGDRTAFVDRLALHRFRPPRCGSVELAKAAPAEAPPPRHSASTLCRICTCFHLISCDEPSRIRSASSPMRREPRRTSGASGADHGEHVESTRG